MISRPTTAQLIADLRTELRDAVVPAIADDTVRVTTQMFDQILAAIAVRCEHEIAWMREETELMVEFARGARAVLEDRQLDTALSALGDAPSSLHLDDVVTTYSAAGRVFSAAIDAASNAGNTALLDRAREVLELRTAHDREVTAEYSPVGR